METYPTPYPNGSERRHPRHRAEVMEPTEHSVESPLETREHQVLPPTETLNPIDEARERNSRMREARTDLDAVYVQAEIQPTNEAPAAFEQPILTTSTEEFPTQPNKQNFFDKLLHRDIHGVKLNRTQSILAATYGAFTAFNAHADHPFRDVLSEESLQFDNPIIRRALYKQAHESSAAAEYVRTNDYRYSHRRELSSAESVAKFSARAVTMLPAVAGDIVTFGGAFLNEKSTNRLIRGIAKGYNAFQRFADNPFAHKEAFYTLDKSTSQPVFADPFESYGRRKR